MKLFKLVRFYKHRFNRPCRVIQSGLTMGELKLWRIKFNDSGKSKSWYHGILKDISGTRNPYYLEGVN